MSWSQHKIQIIYRNQLPIIWLHLMWSDCIYVYIILWIEISVAGNGLVLFWPGGASTGLLLLWCLVVFWPGGTYIDTNSASSSLVRGPLLQNREECSVSGLRSGSEVRSRFAPLGRTHVDSRRRWTPDHGLRRRVRRPLPEGAASPYLVSLHLHNFACLFI